MTTAQLSYLAPLPLYDTEKAFAYNYNRGADVPQSEQTNLQFETHDNVPIHNARVLPPSTLTLDTYGFRFLSHPESCPASFSGSDEEVKQYRDTMTEFVRQEFGGEYAVCCDFRVSISDCNVLQVR